MEFIEELVEIDDIVELEAIVEFKLVFMKLATAL
jgi:hypothetical protein